MKLYLLFIFISSISLCQNLPEGYRILKFNYENDPVELLVIAQPGEELKKKPLFFFLQGSLARPIGIRTDNGYKPFLPPFKNDSILAKYHIVVFSKAFVPPFPNAEGLNDQYIFLDENGDVPKKFLTRDYLDYYVDRNNYILDQLLMQEWVDPNRIVLSGHSQGSSIGVFMASKNENITHLIYASGNPYGRILNTLGQVREAEDTISLTEGVFAKWENAINNPEDDFNEKGGDSNKSIFSFNTRADGILLNLKIPTLVVYGSKDKNTPYIDLLRIESIKSNNEYISFKEYTGMEHNFFPMSKDGKVDYSVDNWNNVAQYWFQWLEEK